MAQTYSTHPFITYDGEDENGVRAEVKVVTGYGHVAKAELSDKGKSCKFSFSVENTKYLPAGWAPIDVNVYSRLKEAEEKNEPIHFRIETRRKPNIDRTLPIEPLTDLANAKDSIFKSIAAVKFEGDEEWTISPHAVTAFSEDPSRGGNGLYRASETSSKGSAVTVLQGAQAYTGVEPPPFITRLSNGAVNPGATAVSAPLELLRFTFEWDLDHGGDPTAQVGERKRPAVAKVLLRAANELQLKIWGGELEHPDLSVNSHSLALSLILEVVTDYYPLSNEVVESKESLLEWKEQIVSKAHAMWEWAMREVDSVVE